MPELSVVGLWWFFNMEFLGFQEKTMHLDFQALSLSKNSELKPYCLQFKKINQAFQKCCICIIALKVVKSC